MAEIWFQQSEPRRGPAAAAGVAAGLVTLGLVFVIIWLIGGSGPTVAAGEQLQVGDLVVASSLQGGECVSFKEPEDQLVLADCDLAHEAQVTNRFPYPDDGSAYPGDDALQDWAGDKCTEAADEFLGTNVLSTSLKADRTLPTADAWAAGDTSATCFVSSLDGSRMIGSAEGRAEDFARGSEVPVFRLMINDCFVPTGGSGAYELNSNSPVEIVSCDESFNGHFFGRDRLSDYTIGTGYPGDDTISADTRDRCGEMFSATFETPAEGFNYRYWRPNAESWAAGDRNILCSVLDESTLEGPFDPTEYEVFSDVEPGRCFNLGPSESFADLRLDDQVRPQTCEQPHQGQMVGSGDLTADDLDEAPSTQEIENKATSECEAKLEELLGRSPRNSEVANFRVWYATTDGWVDGERRYACAFLDSEPIEGGVATELDLDRS